MKNLIKFLAVLLLFVGYTSCDELDELTEVDFNTTVKDVLPVNVDGGEDVLLLSAVVINIADGSGDIQDYLDKIEEVRINSLTYEIKNFLGDATGVITVNLIADGVTMATHTNVTVSNEVGVMYSISDVTTLNAIASKLKNGQDVSFSASGTATSEGGMSFDIEITLDLKVIADAL